MQDTKQRKEIQNQDLGQRAATGSAASGKERLRQELAGASYDEQLALLQPGPAAAPGGGSQGQAELGTRAAGRPLPFLSRLQQAFGAHDLSGVQLHTGAQATTAASQLGARAYAFGEHIVAAAPLALPELAHEVAHVIQQRLGLVPSDTVSRPGDAAEQVAETVAEAVVAGDSVEQLLPPAPGSGAAASSGGSATAVQRITHSGLPVDIGSLTVEECREHLGRIARKSKGVVKGDDADYAYDPTDKDAIALRMQTLQEQQAKANLLLVVSDLSGQLTSLATASAFTTPPPWASVPTTGKLGSETFHATALSHGQVVARWQAFLGSGPYSNLHPRTGAPDPTRLTSADGLRSIRYGNHEQTSDPPLHHFHEETWTWDSVGTVTVANIVRRVPVK